ncbi:hypothetical protein GCM10014719_09840 [Planomonospora parontospora subsp. antibiotica]|nr:hypothetical protein GCM10014719_09840 [Planomonospora parontospora subsp. antibiotica]GII14698.1 hypothetical protein Ppa05_14240 [Planomonospora parontospora subsp. antibiotica]
MAEAFSSAVLSPVTLTAITSRHAAAIAATADMIFTVSGRSRPRAASDRRVAVPGAGVAEDDMTFLHGGEEPMVAVSISAAGS